MQSQPLVIYLKYVGRNKPQPKMIITGATDAVHIYIFSPTSPSISLENVATLRIDHDRLQELRK